MALNIYLCLVNFYTCKMNVSPLIIPMVHIIEVWIRYCVDHFNMTFLLMVTMVGCFLKLIITHTSHDIILWQIP